MNKLEKVFQKQNSDKLQMWALRDKEVGGPFMYQL